MKHLYVLYIFFFFKLQHSGLFRQSNSRISFLMAGFWVLNSPKGADVYFPHIFVFSLKLFCAAPVLSNTFGAQLDVNNVWARRRIRKPLWTLSLSVCLSLSYIHCLHLFYSFFSPGLKKKTSNLSVFVSCSEVCRLWPRWSGSIWEQ